MDLKQQGLDDAKKATDDALNCLIDSCQAKLQLLRNEHDKLRIRNEELQRQYQQSTCMTNDEHQVSDDDILQINVSGHIISVERGVLTQIKGSGLEALFSGRWDKRLQPKKDEPILLDVNYECFQIIVEYLKKLKAAGPNNPPKYIKSQIINNSNTVFLDRLLLLFGLEKAYSCPKIDDSKILNGLEETHALSLLRFLEEDNVDGNLELIYRASRDGWKGTDFHSKCDNKGPTVTLIKSTGGFVFGGFADTTWVTSSGEWKTSEKAFLFALKSHSGLVPTKMKQKNGSYRHYAVYHNYLVGPTFGGAYDIYVADSANSNNNSYTSIGHTYECPTGQTSDRFLTGSQCFQAEEIEVFAVVPLKNLDLKLPKDTKNSNGIGYSTKNEPWRQMTFEEFPEDLEEAMDMEQKEIIASWDKLLELERKFYQEKTFVDFIISGNVTNTYHGYKETQENES